MTITKDEARVFAAILEDAKYETNNKDMFLVYDCLQKKMHAYSQDMRRTGRTSMDDYSDLIKRIASKNGIKQD